MVFERFRAGFTWCCFPALLVSITFVLQACTTNSRTAGFFQGMTPECSIDVVLILDKSKSVGSNWASVRNAAYNFVSKLEQKNRASNGDSQIAVLSFARRAEWGTELTDSFSWAKTKILEIEGLKWCSRPYPALDEVALQLIGSTKTENQKVAIVFTDGEPTCDRDAADKAFDSARSFKNYGRLVIVGMKAQGGRRRRHGDEDLMKSLATYPPDENYFDLHSFGGASGGLIDSVVEGVCKKPATPTPTPTPAPAQTPTQTPTPPAFGGR